MEEGKLQGCSANVRYAGLELSGDQQVISSRERNGKELHRFQQKREGMQSVVSCRVLLFLRGKAEMQMMRVAGLPCGVSCTASSGHGMYHTRW